MRDMDSLGLRVRNGQLEVLDQQSLPNKEVWVNCSSPDDMVECIYHLKVRGAPLIGVAAALSLTQFAEKGATESGYREAATKLRDSSQSNDGS